MVIMKMGAAFVELLAVSDILVAHILHLKKLLNEI